MFIIVNVMRFVETIIGSKTKTKLLGFLLEHKKDSYTISELAKLAHIPKSGVSKVVEEWEGSGLIKVIRIGNTKAVGIDQDFFLLSELSRLFTEPPKRAHKFAKRFAKSLLHRVEKDVAALVVYGSVARREVGTLSDIDILVVVSSSRAKDEIKEKVLRYSASIATLKKITISPAVMTKKEVEARVKERDKFIRNVLTEGEALAGGEYIEHLKRAL